MTVLARGGNAPITARRLEVAVTGARQGSVDLMAFQLGPDRKVRSDADFVFFNQPASPEGAVRLVAADRITADLGAVPPGVQTLAIAVALDESVSGSLAAIQGLAVTLSGGGSSGGDSSGGDSSGSASHSAPAAGLTTERAAVLVEIYRRAGDWKVRNVSAGWAAGLSALAAEHGVVVDAAPQQAPRAMPAAASGDQTRYPMPGAFPPPGGSLPTPPEFVAPRPGGWPAPGGSLPLGR